MLFMRVRGNVSTGQGKRVGVSAYRRVGVLKIVLVFPFSVRRSAFNVSSIVLILVFVVVLQLAGSWSVSRLTNAERRTLNAGVSRRS
jgi:hypothetical protein